MDLTSLAFHYAHMCSWLGPAKLIVRFLFQKLNDASASKILVVTTKYYAGRNRIKQSTLFYSHAAVYSI